MEPVIKLNPGATKWDIRQKVWDYIEANNLAHFPRPVHNRIPNFKGAHCACAAVADLESFHRTSEVKVDPDKPLEGARLAVLQARKTLLVPTPRLRAGLFNRIVPPQGASKEDLHVCSTSQGVKDFSVPVGLEAKVRVDLVVVGSVAVSEKGYRIGKGEGYADMEYAMMVSMEAISSATVVVTVVHDCQVVDIPEELIEKHDLTVDYILTPTRVIQTECKWPKPQGIIWTKLNADMLERIPVLQKLRALEQKSGKDVSLGRADLRGEVVRPGGGRTDAGVDDRAVNTLHLGGVPAGLRVSELKRSLQERGALPQRLIWQGANGRAFLDYGDHEKAQAALTALQALSINGHNMQVAFARGQRSRRRPGVPQRTGKVTESQTPNWSLKRS
ncbi:methenyltetrahydrofolate synthase domain-containing protein isoform X1 [Paramormyrops kingsleyae]|uniref:Methenyltetrahydrofolate synthase domain-containing protein n=1 Tax=Paramormyrops kingsleyae TaxID=1676925 RepID=A0A3B3Q6R6_9TELE|nr:methenyltetrahydrofolate synthase domain-containing protein isoform X1 [Paramormyrops kingsleyae]